MVLGHKTRIPAIVLLLAGGIVLGPEVLGWVDPHSLGHGLEAIVAITVSVILFEGGLTLDIGGYRRAPVVIKRLLTFGALTTWLVTAGAVALVLDLPASMALMMGSLVIVTGPTVISPLLRRMQIRSRLHHILYWEGVLIDVVGVFIALLCYEWLKPDPLHEYLGPLARFGLRVCVGFLLGLATGFLIGFVLERNIVAEEHTNTFVLGCALLAYGIAQLVLSESGILSVVVAGFYVAWRHPPQLRRVRQFKLELTEFGIGLVFVLLAAKLDLSHFTDPRLLVLLAIILFVVRPLGIWISTHKQRFELKEKLFLSWVAPRGIVSAAMASLFALRLQQSGHVDAHYLEVFTYAVVVTTVTLQGLTAPTLSRLLGLKRSTRKEWVVVGTSLLARQIGQALRRSGVQVVEAVVDEAEQLPDLAEPRFADATGVLCIDSPGAPRPPLKRYRECLGEEGTVYYTSIAGEQKAREHKVRGVVRVWDDVFGDGALLEALSAGTYAIEAFAARTGLGPERFGAGFRPLFWVRNGNAEVVREPTNIRLPAADYAVVLRKKLAGLADLVAHIQVFPEAKVSLENIIVQLLVAAQRQHPKLPVEEIANGVLERDHNMLAAVGGGLAIPHAYVEGLAKSRCYMGILPNGALDVATPDNQPVQMVCLLLSPADNPSLHLEGLATLSGLGLDRDLFKLLVKQTVPELVDRLLRERA